MKIYRLYRRQVLPIGLSEAWSFFSTPRNLKFITPEYMEFRILEIAGNEEMYPGQIIRYVVNIFPYIPVQWTTEITHVKPLEMFVDEQRSGPYRLWHHRHHFQEVSNGVEMTDDVHYALPFGIIGRLAHGVFVENQLNTIFDYRRDVLKKRFSAQ